MVTLGLRKRCQNTSISNKIVRDDDEKAGSDPSFFKSQRLRAYKYVLLKFIIS